jgi:hypothetical protein
VVTGGGEAGGGGARCYLASQVLNAANSLLSVDTPNTTQTPECTKDKYNVKIIKCRVSPKVPPTTYVGQRIE